MRLVRGAWKILVGIKDALVLILLLLFFAALFAALSARPNRAAIHDGALVLRLDGTIVEQPEEVDPFAALSGRSVAHQYRLRDVVRALDAARTDDHVKAVVLDLDRFMGAYPSTLVEVGDAIRRVRASGKPVLAYATAYTDSGYLLAANASQIWTNPMGGVLLRGPGGSQLYYKGLIDKLGINAHIYRVGQYKSAVEPYMRSDQSPAAKQAATAMYDGIFDEWKQVVAKARPQAKIQPFLTNAAQAVEAAGGDLARANLAAGMVDKLGGRVAFGQAVAKIVGAGDDMPAGNFNAIDYSDFVAAHPMSTKGAAIGVITVAGDIVDGKAKPGSAGGDTISKLILDGLKDDKLKALVVRVASPGGSALASEQIRQAILQAKAQGLPVVTSMGSLAASGGYWVSTAGDVIYAEPNTITGSIGIFGIIPTFENTLKKIGVTTDGVKTTPLSGQPDIYGGTDKAFDDLLQAQIEDGYSKFVGVVSKSRHLTPERVNEIGQGRVWLGGPAHQIGLVDKFGGLQDAIAEAARRAKLDPKDVHAVYLEKKPSDFAKFVQAFTKKENGDDDDGDHVSADLFGHFALERRETMARALGDARRLAEGGSVQARCLQCTALAPASASPSDTRLLDLILNRLTR
ncbi:signal peptide peptidase SppA [Stakelama sediminis]|uniref:signal peptide peptidase SppA n=1 Tax=Stakelama sediminis TaxID=463200 RepID=UPI00160A3B99